MLSVSTRRPGAIDAPTRATVRCGRARAPANHPAPGVPGLERQRDVLGDGQLRKKRRLLVDCRNPKGAR